MAVLALASTQAADPPRYDPAAIEALDAMAQAADGVQDYTMRLVKRELRGKTLGDEETLDVKWQRPQKIYLHGIDTVHKGREVLFVPGVNKNRIKVHPGSFPDITLNLDPYGHLAMSESHHPVPEVSLVHLVALIGDNVRRARAKNFGTISVNGHETVFGRPTLVIEAKMPATGTTPTIAKGQTIWDLAKATGQDMYVILHANRARHWTRPEHPEPGDAVLVPEFYAGRMVVWIDDVLRLPIQIDLYDHEGTLYEHYEHRHLALNVGLTPTDFDAKNPAYRF
jgi:outer membrane lipoprotein-sorting protein